MICTLLAPCNLSNVLSLDALRTSSCSTDGSHSTDLTTPQHNSRADMPPSWQDLICRSCIQIPFKHISDVLLKHISDVLSRPGCTAGLRLHNALSCSARTLRCQSLSTVHTLSRHQLNQAKQQLLLFSHHLQLQHKAGSSKHAQPECACNDQLASLIACAADAVLQAADQSPAACQDAHAAQ